MVTLVQSLEDELQSARRNGAEARTLREELEQKYEEARQQAERATEALRSNLESSTACTESLTEYKYVS